MTRKQSELEVQRIVDELLAQASLSRGRVPARKKIGKAVEQPLPKQSANRKRR
jgi:hypothetical protein